MFTYIQINAETRMAEVARFKAHVTGILPVEKISSWRVKVRHHDKSDAEFYEALGI